MKKIKKRTLFVITSGFITTAAIGVPAAIVYATKNDISKEGVAQNIENEIENRIFGAIKLIPSKTSGSFGEKVFEDEQNKLNKLKSDLSDTRKVFTKEVKARIPMYGIMNDALVISERFNTYEEIQKRTIKAIDAINGEHWDTLKAILFDAENNGASALLSKSYGVERHDLEEFEIKDGPNAEKVSSRIQNTFISFGDYVSRLKKDDFVAGSITKQKYVETIVNALQLVSGIEFTNSGRGISYITSKYSETESVAKMIFDLKDLAQNNENAKETVKQWEVGILPAWKARFAALDQFFTDVNDVMSDKKIEGMSNIKLFEKYDEAYEKVIAANSKYTGILNKTEGKDSFKDSVQAFLDGDSVLEADSTIKDNSNNYLTNWDFARVFFGESLGKMSSIYKSGGTNSDSFSGSFGIDSILSKNTTSKIGVNKDVISGYWNKIVKNIFNKTLIPTIEDDGSWHDKSILNKLSNIGDFEKSHEILSRVTNTYNNEITKINNSSFSIGIKIGELNDIIKSYGLKDGWRIKINSLVDRYINEDSLNKVASLLKYKTNNDGTKELEYSDKFNTLDGYIFPQGPEWLLRASDSLSIENVKFDGESKLSEFEKFSVGTTIFKPYVRIDEGAGTTDIKMLWDHIDGPKTGGEND